MNKPVTKNVEHETLSFKGKLKGQSSEKLHKHGHHQFLYISKGVSLLIDHEQQQPQYGSHTAFIPYGTLHRSLVMGSELEFQSIFVKKELFNISVNSIKLFNISELGKALFDYLCAENRKNFSEGYTGKCLDLFLETMQSDIKHETKILRLPVSENSIIKNITQYLHDNYSNKFNLTDLEKAVPYTIRHIARIFQHEMNMTLLNYLKTYRIIMSTLFLDDASKSVQQIAYECGYESISNFYRDFNYFFNCSPNEYRKKLNHYGFSIHSGLV